MENNEKDFDEQKALSQLEKGYDKAEEILNDKDKLEELLQRLEKKLKVVPVIGDKLSEVPAMASLIKSYVKKEYTKVPIGTIVAIISALTYFVSPIDLIPDTIPVAGYLDDAAVITACLKLVETDVVEYVKWRKDNGKELEV